MEKSPVGYEIDCNNSTFEKIIFKSKTFNFRDITSFEIACKHFNINPDNLPDLSMIPLEFRKYIIAHYKLMTIIKAINNGWVPDWNNSNMKKWYPWFNMSSGFGFSHSYYCYGDTDAAVGSRLCLETEEKSAYMGKQFTDLYKDFLK